MRNLLIAFLLSFLSFSTAHAGVLGTSSEVKTGAPSPAPEKVVPIDSVLDGVSGVLKTLTEPLSSLEIPASLAEKKETAPEKTEASPPAGNKPPQIIPVKRLDKPDGGKASETPPEPYKVYAAPLVAEDQPQDPLLDTGESPRAAAPVFEKTPPASDNFQAWEEGAVKTVDLRKPPPLPQGAREAALTGALPPSLKGEASALPQGSGRQSAPGRGGVPPVSALPKQFFPIVPMGAIASGTVQLLPLASNVGLSTGDAHARRVILYIHDLTRNAAEGIATLMTLSGGGEEEGETLILAPQFPLDVDIMRFSKHLPDSGRQVARWRVEDNWSWGGESVLSPGKKGISSFTALDILLLYLSDRERFPALEKIVLVGHGQGGDFVQRYAAVGKAPAVLKREGLPLRFVVANPSSYLYLTASRFSEKAGRFTAADTATCPEVNTYPYGLAALGLYAKAIGANAIRLNYPEQSVLYLVGDKILVDNYLDRSCAAMAQGADRTARGKLYDQYIKRSFGDFAQSHKVVIVPNAGHDPVSVFGSSSGMDALFGP